MTEEIKHRLKSLIEAQPHDPKCNLTKAVHVWREEGCNCWKADALSQLSAANDQVQSLREDRDEWKLNAELADAECERLRRIICGEPPYYFTFEGVLHSQDTAIYGCHVRSKLQPERQSYRLFAEDKSTGKEWEISDTELLQSNLHFYAIPDAHQ